MENKSVDYDKVSEVDRLQYRGNVVPKFIRLIWTLFTLFAIFYMIKFAWPDLMVWLRIS